MSITVCYKKKLRYVIELIIRGYEYASLINVQRKFRLKTLLIICELNAKQCYQNRYKTKQRFRVWPLISESTNDGQTFAFLKDFCTTFYHFTRKLPIQPMLYSLRSFYHRLLVLNYCLKSLNYVIIDQKFDNNESSRKTLSSKERSSAEDPRCNFRTFSYLSKDESHSPKPNQLILIFVTIFNNK